MNFDWKKNEDATGVLTATVEGEEWEKAQKKAYNALKQNLEIKGFRKGQVPDALAKTRIPMEEVTYTAARKFFDKGLQEGIEEYKIELVDTPKLNIKEMEPAKLVLEYECVVTPEVKLGEYKGLDIKKAPVEVTEEEINKELENVQNRYADWVLREDDEPAEEGDQVTIDYIGEKEGVPFDGGAANNYPLVLGSHTFIPGFEEQLIGIKPGETREINLTFPEDYPAAELAGAPVVFKVTAHDIKFKEKPEINDELIGRMKAEGIDTVEKYKEEAKNQLLANKENQAETDYNNAIMNAIVAGAEVEIPAVMIDNEVENLYRDFQSRLAQSGFTAEQFLQATGQKEEDIKENMKPQAEARVKGALVLDAIAAAENLEVADEDLEKEYKLMSEMYSMPADQIKAIITPDQMKGDMLQQKALQFVKDNTKSE